MSEICTVSNPEISRPSAVNPDCWGVNSSGSTIAPDAPDRDAPSRPSPEPLEILRRGLASLREDSPGELRILIARACGALGVPELALAWAGGAASDPGLAGLAGQIRSAAASMPGSVVPHAVLIANVERCLHARPDLREQLGGTLETWSSLQHARAWHRANNGARLVVDADASACGTLRGVRVIGGPFYDPAREILTNEGIAGGPPPPIVLDGVASPASLADLAGRFTRLPDRSWARIYAIETDPMHMLDVLASCDDTEMLEQSRVRFFIGPDAKVRLLTHLGAARDQWSKLTYLPGASGGADTTLAERLVSLAEDRGREYRALCAANNATYAGRDRAWWSERFEAAGRGEAPPLRFLLPTTRYSTYVQHATRDIASALEARGCRTRLLIEADDSSLSEGLSAARAVSEFEPDAIIVTNYTRSTFGDSVPNRIPFVCWIQDELSHMFTNDFARDVDELTLLVGNIYMSLPMRFGVPVERCLSMGVPASAAKFEAPILDRPGTDLFIATNHGESPQAMRDRLCDECVAAGGPADLIPDLHRSVASLLDAWRVGHLQTHLERIVRDACVRHGVRPDGENAASLLRDGAKPLANRMLRHRLVEWAITLAQNEGVSLRIAGRGWDGHDSAERYWIGEVPHGPELRDEYQNAAVSLQSSAASLLHQRVHECLLSGGMLGLMLTPEDRFAVLRPARQTMAHLTPSCSTIADRRLRVRPWDHPIVARSLSTAQRVFPAPDGMPDAAGDDQVFAMQTGLMLWARGRDEQIPWPREAVGYEDQARFIDAISPGMFVGPDGLRALVKRARHDPGWRRAHIEHARSLSRSFYSYEYAADQIVGGLSAQLAGSGQNPE